MIIKEINSQDDAVPFYKLSRAFYETGATKRQYNQKLSELTFKQVISKHENLWGYFIIDGESKQIAGYSLVTSYWCCEEGGNVLILDELYIDAEFRHKHLGKNFMAWLAKDYSDRAVALTLEVLSTNEIAKDLYFKDGFAEDGFVTMTKQI